MFEVQCRVLETSEERDILLVTTSRDAFATILATLNENNAISYEANKKRLNENIWVKNTNVTWKVNLEI